MLLCDYCTEPIDPDTAPVTIGGTAPPSTNATPTPPEMVRFDFHIECLAAWHTAAKGVRGKRGNRNNGNNTKP